MSLTDLKNRSRVVRDEVQLKANTANRVGQILMDAVDYLITLTGLSHSHSNKPVLDELGENTEQKLTYRGQVIETTPDVNVTTWIDPPVIKILEVLPEPLVEDDRYILESTGAIYTVISNNWVIDISTTPVPAEASAVIVRLNSDDEEINAIHIFENGVWVNKSDEFNMDESRLVTAYDSLNGRKLIPFTGSPDAILETGFFYGADNVIGNPLYEEFGRSQTDMIYYIHQNHNTGSAYQIAYRVQGGNEVWVRSKETTWGAWRIQNTPIDNDTITIESEEYVVQKIKGQTVSVDEINYLKDVSSNIQEQIDTLSAVGNFTGTSPDYASITTLFPAPNDKDLVIVITDETHSNQTSLYIYSSSLASWVYSGTLSVTVTDVLKLNQTPKQTLTGSPIFSNLTAKRIPFAGADKSLSDSTYLYWDETNKRLGIGIAIPLSRIHVKETSLLNNIGTEFINVELSQTTSITGAYTTRGLYVPLVRNVNAGITDSSTVYGAQFSATATGNVHRGTLNRLVGTSYIAGIIGTGTTGTITRVEGLSVTPYCQSGTISEFYGLYINGLLGSGTVTLKYGIYCNFDAQSFLKGSLGLGVLLPTEKLDVDGNIKASGSIQIGNNSESPIESLKGTVRYSEGVGYSVVEMCMKTGASTYEWIEIKRIEWTV